MEQVTKVPNSLVLPPVCCSFKFKSSVKDLLTVFVVSNPLIFSIHSSSPMSCGVALTQIWKGSSLLFADKI